jgi:hypothetical protein
LFVLMPEALQVEECLNPWGLPPASIHDWTINSLEEAREVLAHHTREQRYEGILKRPNVRFGHFASCRLIIVVEAQCKPYGIIHRPYEYTMTCGAEEIEEIKSLVESRCWLRNINRRTERKRWKDEEALEQQAKPRPLRQKEPLRAPLKQLHVFAQG